jgi:hypothetical protein
MCTHTLATPCASWRKVYVAFSTQLSNKTTLEASHFPVKKHMRKVVLNTPKVVHEVILITLVSVTFGLQSSDTPCLSIFSRLSADPISIAHPH